MKISAIQCPLCHDTIYSRARHDFRYCSCKNVFVDGGLDYFRAGWDQKGETIELEMEVTEQELYNDWNYRHDKFGVINNGR